LQPSEGDVETVSSQVSDVSAVAGTDAVLQLKRHRKASQSVRPESTNQLRVCACFT